MLITRGGFTILDYAIAAGFLAPIVFVDLKRKRIPDALVYPAILALGGWRLLSGRLPPGALLELAVGFASLGALWLASRGRIGLGDAKLSAFLAFLLGLQGWIVAVFLASLGGVTFTLVGMRLGRMTGRESLPFAPFLAAGTAAVGAATALLPGGLPVGRLWLETVK